MSKINYFKSGIKIDNQRYSEIQEERESDSDSDSEIQEEREIQEEKGIQKYYPISIAAKGMKSGIDTYLIPGCGKNCGYTSGMAEAFHDLKEIVFVLVILAIFISVAYYFLMKNQSD